MTDLSLADFDLAKLSPRSRETLERIAAPLSDGDGRKDIAELAGELGLTTKTVREAMDELKLELSAQRAGATLPELSQAEYEGLRDSIAEFGQLVPIVRVNGAIVDGHHRERACLELGRRPWYVESGREDYTAHELELVTNVVRRHLTTAQRRQAVEAELVHDPTRSDRSIAVLFGMSPTTVGGIRAGLEQRGKVSRLDRRQTAQGREQHVAGPEPEHEPELDVRIPGTLARRIRNLLERVAREFTEELDGELSAEARELVAQLQERIA